MSTNPYEPPKLVESEALDARCSFCGRLWKDTGPLIVAPYEHSYICRTCAQVVVQRIDDHSSGKRPIVGTLSVTTVTLIGLAALVWVLAGLVAVLQRVVERW